jgi:hypothetical protein
MPDCISSWLGHPPFWSMMNHKQLWELMDLDHFVNMGTANMLAD